MTENEVVLNLLDFYKRKGVDLYRIIDDPSFKALSKDTQLLAIKNYANHILAGTPQGLVKNDWKYVLRNALQYGGLGLVGGALTAAGTAAAYSKGKIPPEAITTGALIGAIGGAAGAGFDLYHRRRSRLMIGGELTSVSRNPTEANASNVLTMNYLMGQPELQNKFIDKIKGSVDKVLDTQSQSSVQHYVTDYNENYLKNTKR